MKMKRNNKFYVSIVVLILTILCSSSVLKGQFSDTLTNVYKDKELVDWTENYIVKAGFINKTSKGYQVPLFSTYYKDVSGLYSLFIIEKQDFDTAVVTLYRLHAGSDHTHSFIVERVVKSNGKSLFKVFGEKRTLESVNKLHLAFNQYRKFTIGTKEYCYDLLLQNYNTTSQ